MKRPVFSGFGWALALCSLLLLPWSSLDAQTEDATRPPTQAVSVDPSLLQAMHYRNIGPYRGGRVTAVAGYPDRPFTFLMGTVGGGIWRTVDAGTTWENISDGFLNVGPVGALAIAPSTEDVVYAGTGSGGARRCR